MNSKATGKRTTQQQRKSLTLDQAIKNVVNYYAFFQYPALFEEVYRFLPTKSSKKEFERALSNLVAQKKVIKHGSTAGNETRYAIPPYRINNYVITEKRANAQAKQIYIRQYIAILKILPCIQLVGLSGSCAMEWCTKDDDIDLFVITQKGRMWSARFYCLLIATIMGMRRKRGSVYAPNKVCLNMFFDESNLLISKYKQNIYTAHEVLQMKPLFAKSDTYDRFLKANQWVFEYFPNVENVSLGGNVTTAKTRKDPRHRLLTKIGDIVESLFKRYQLFLINRHKTTEIITSTQLWFFPQDFEKKLRKNGLVD